MMQAWSVPRSYPLCPDFLLPRRWYLMLPHPFSSSHPSTFLDASSLGQADQGAGVCI